MDDELSITDLIDFFLETWVSLLAAAVGGLGLGLALSFALPKQYEIKALVQIAEVGGLGRAEPPAVVIERIKTDGFRARVGQALGDAQVTASIKIDPVRSLSDQAFNLRNQFDENRTFPTRLFVEPVVSVGIAPVFPRPELFAALGFLLGGMLMLVVQVLRRVKRPQPSPASDSPTPA
ncbi:MAG: hypothetical protein RJA17_1314 [Pseudomonadota bacterium]|jgi:hypothetical protein